MALDSYSNLQAAISDWLVRPDLTTQIPDFIALAEARINRELRVREMVTQATGTVATQSLAIPSDFVEVKRFTLDTASDMPLEYRPLEDSELRVAGTTSGQPRWFSVLGSEWRLYPAPDGSYSYTLDYYAKVPKLSASNTSNWLLVKAPDLYLYGALAEAYSFLLEEDREQYWASRFDRVKGSLHLAEARTKRTSGPRRMRVVA